MREREKDSKLSLTMAKQAKDARKLNEAEIMMGNSD